MLLGRDPQYAFELIERLHLHPLIFLYDHSSTYLSSDATPPDPKTTEVPDLPNTSISVIASNLLTQLLNQSSSASTSNLPALHPLLQLHVVAPPPLPPHSAVPPYPEPIPLTSTPSPSSPSLALIYPHTSKRLYLSCGLLPLYDLSITDKKKVMWVGEKVVRDGIKGPTIDMNWCRKLREGWEVLSGKVGEFEEKRIGQEKNDERDRVELGRITFSASSRAPYCH